MAGRLTAVLERSRGLGFLGPGDVGAHEAHSLAFADAWASRSGQEPPRSVLDLGSGGGVPGLVLADRWRGSRVVLLDATRRRCEFLREAVEDLGFGGRCEVREGRAEVLARDPVLEGSFDLVVARSFGPPAVVAECAARFLSVGGVLLVAEPPDPGLTASRWPVGGLAELGLGPAEVVEGSGRLVLIPAVTRCAERYPRREGIPSKRPLF